MSTSMPSVLHSKQSPINSLLRGHGTPVPLSTVNGDAKIDGPAKGPANVNGPVDGPTNVTTNGHVKHVVADQTGGETLTAAQRQQEANGSAVRRPNAINVGSRNVSFIEQKEDRKAEREAKDEEQRRIREAHT